MSTPSRRSVLASGIVSLGLFVAAGDVAAEGKEAKPMHTKTRINFKCTADTGTFARYIPFGDQREVIVRRGKELGFDYGFEMSRRKVTIQGRKFDVVRSQATLSPPPMRPGGKPMSKEAAKQYQPESEVLYLPDAEILIRRVPEGFSDAEVEKILAAISFE